MTEEDESISSIFFQGKTAPFGQQLGCPFTRAMESKINIKLDKNNNSSFSLYQGADSNQTDISGVVWDCGMLLVDCLIDYKTLIPMETVLDLGCGTGIGGIACALLNSNNNNNDMDNDNKNNNIRQV